MVIGSLADLIRSHARRRPDAPALTAGAERLTFADLDRRSNQVAAALVAAGVAPGDRVAYLGKNTLAVLRAAVRGQQGRGGDRPRELASGAGGDRRHPRRLDRRRAGRRAGVRRDGRAGGRPPAAVRHVLTLDRAAFAGSESFERWADVAAPDDPGHEPAADDVALQLYTSGTTGPAEGRDAHQPQRVEHAAGDVARLGVRRGQRQPRGAAQLPRRRCRLGARRPLRRRLVGGAARVRRRRGARRDLRAPRHPRRARARRAARPAGGGGPTASRRQLVGGAGVRRLADRRERARRGGAHAPVRLHPGVRADRDGRRRDPAARRRPRPRGAASSTGCARRAGRWRGRGARRRAGERRRRRRPAPSARSGCGRHE